MMGFRFALKNGFIVLLAVPAAAFAQAQPTVVPSSPPELRDFQLRPGNEARPAEEGPLIAPLKPKPAPAKSPVTLTPQPPAPAASHPAEMSPAKAPARTARRIAPEPRPEPVERQSAREPPKAKAPAPEPAHSDPVAAPTQPKPEPASPAPEQPAPSRLPWLALLLGLLAVGAIAYAIRERRKAKARAEAEALAAERARAAQRAAERAAAAAKAAEAARIAEQRARIELVFTPEHAGATDAEASVNFSLAIRNTGKVPARDVRIDGRMVSAGERQNAELTAFFAAAFERGLFPPQVIPPGRELLYKGIVTLPRERVHPIQVQGRSIFVPVVAFNALYEWGEGQRGQTAKSWMVGRRPETPSARMAPFRLDLGPRIYHNVAQRRHDLERVA